MTYVQNILHRSTRSLPNSRRAKNLHIEIYKDENVRKDLVKTIDRNSQLKRSLL